MDDKNKSLIGKTDNVMKEDTREPRRGRLG